MPETLPMLTMDGFAALVATIALHWSAYHASGHYRPRSEQDCSADQHGLNTVTPQRQRWDQE